MRRRTTKYTSNSEYSQLGRTAQTLYEAYHSDAGKIVEGVLQGGLGATVAGMSLMADNEMLGIHAALGATWAALTLKNFAEAGHNYLNGTRKDVEDIGIEILTYAKVRAGNFRGSEENFIATINSEIAQAITDSLTDSNAPELSNDEESREAIDSTSTKEKFSKIARERSAMRNEKILAVTAAIGTLAIGGGVGAMALAGSNATIFKVGVGLAAAGTLATSTSGGLMNASASNSRNISKNMLKSLEQLNNPRYNPKLTGIDLDESKIDEIRDHVRKEEFEKKNPGGSPQVDSKKAGKRLVVESVELNPVV